MKIFPDNVNSLSEIVIYLESMLGITRVIQYTIYILILVGILNFSKLVEYGLKVRDQIERKEHERRLELRDDLMAELNPMLIELRSTTGASRLLYFEYHNSTENFVGIPFKFANLVLANQEYECPDYDPSKYKDINSGLISGLYTDLRKHQILIHKGGYNCSSFHEKYPGIHEFFSAQEGSTQQLFINIPGVNSPIGMIVLEWVDKKEMSDKEWEEIANQVHLEIPRINALISKFTP